jgi:hypothetical protein
MTLTVQSRWILALLMPVGSRWKKPVLNVRPLSLLDGMGQRLNSALHAHFYAASKQVSLWAKTF